MIARLRKLYRESTVEQRERGRAWYPLAEAKLRGLAVEYGRTLEEVACILAITSPRTNLVENFARTRRALRGEPVRGFGYMDDAVKDPCNRVNGPKVEAFAKACSGDLDAFVLDTWALRAAGLPEKPSKPQREACEQAYRKLARESGETVRDLQAIIWISLRENHVERVGHKLTPNGTKVRRRDIHELKGV